MKRRFVSVVEVLLLPLGAVAAMGGSGTSTVPIEPLAPPADPVTGSGWATAADGGPGSGGPSCRQVQGVPCGT